MNHLIFLSVTCMPADTLLLVFVKHPVPGQVKTRLAATLGHEKALMIYQDLLAFTCDIVLRAGYETHIYYGNEIPAGDLWARADLPRFLQSGADLGARMQQAFSAGFEAGYRRIIVIGSDCPYLSPEGLRAGFEALDQAAAVIGPALDGGYYLLGMKTWIPEVFQAKKWSTDTVLQDTLADLDRLGHTYALLPELGDIDEAGDLAGTFLAHYLDQA
ncbi:MAG: TIGR04282 family arsenosugar biosynthesis glycosyltransferase [Bacteroidia bacterium]|nr:TIGR04282 family arsenosugar biosynthesis glycosyltransferase [Bacteroidia bacterium]